MFAIYFDVREDALNFTDGFFCGMSDYVPEISSDIFPKANCFDTMLRAEQMAKLVMALQPSILGYQIKEISADTLCPNFQCTAYQTKNCGDYEGCIGCSVYGNCNFCSKENCVTDCAYHRCFAKEHGRINTFPSGIVLH